MNAQVPAIHFDVSSCRRSDPLTVAADFPGVWFAERLSVWRSALPGRLPLGRLMHMPETPGLIPNALSVRASSGYDTLYIAPRQLSAHPGQPSILATCNPVPSSSASRSNNLIASDSHSGLNRLNNRRFNMQTHQSARSPPIPSSHSKISLEANCQPGRSQSRLAERSEAQIVRWVQFPAGALFFVLAKETKLRSSLHI